MRPMRPLLLLLALPLIGLLALGVVVAILAVSGLAARNLGLEFLPRLEEGNLYVRGTMPSSISLEAGNAYVEKIRGIVREVPEVVTGLIGVGFIGAAYLSSLVRNKRIEAAGGQVEHLGG